MIAPVGSRKAPCRNRRRILRQACSQKRNDKALDIPLRLNECRLRHVSPRLQIADAVCDILLQKPAAKPEQLVEHAVNLLTGAGKIEAHNRLPAHGLQRLTDNQLVRLCRQLPVNVAHAVARTVSSEIVKL